MIIILNDINALSGPEAMILSCDRHGYKGEQFFFSLTHMLIIDPVLIALTAITACPL